MGIALRELQHCNTATLQQFVRSVAFASRRTYSGKKKISQKKEKNLVKYS